MKSRATEETMCLLTGAALGAAALYLMDPKSGQQRRQRLASTAGGLVDEVLGSAKTSAHSMAGTAQNLADRLSSHIGKLQQHADDHAHDLAGQARDLAAGLTNRATGYLRQGQAAAQDVAGNADDWHRWTAKHVSRASHKAQSWLGHDEPEGFGVGTLLSSTLGCCVVGASIMYLLDPERGRARRSWIVGKTGKTIRHTGRRMRGVGQDIANRLHGLTHSSTSAARGYMSQTQVDSEQLVTRLRSAVGHILQRADRIQFSGDTDGTVTVTGDIAGDEVDRLLNVLHGVPGVTHVINRLTIAGANNPMPSAT